MRIGSIPMAAVTQDMLDNPGLMVLSPFFQFSTEPTKVPQESSEQQECECCPCCGCTCGDEF